MKFLFENDSIRDIKQAKEFVEQQKKVNYNNLTSSQKNDFIINIIKNMYNSKELSKANLAIVRALEDSNLNNVEFNNYLNNLTNQKINDDTIGLLYTLFKKRNLNFNRDKDWLLSNDIYDRDLDDTLYTIKALTFASDKKLQRDDNGKNKYFNKYLKVNDLIKDGKILSADEIVDIINKKQTRGFNNINNKDKSFKGVDVFKKAIKSNKYDLNSIIEYIFNTEDIIGDNALGNEDAIEDYLKSNDGKKDIVKVLRDTYTRSNILGTKYSEKDMLNSAFKDIITRFLDKKKKSDKDTKQSGSDVLTNNGITTFNRLKTLAVQSAYPNSDQETQREIFRAYLDSADGKRGLIKILNKNYNDTFVGSALDQIKDDLAELAQNIQISSKG